MLLKSGYAGMSSTALSAGLLTSPIHDMWAFGLVLHKLKDSTLCKISIPFLSQNIVDKVENNFYYL